jgi:OOP family OmpA-OmpF porin
MNKVITAVVFLAVALAGCSTASGPTFDAYSITKPNQPKEYLVRCEGLLEGHKVCEDKAREICGTEQVRPLDMVAPYSTGRDMGIMRFRCGADPVAQQQPVPAPIPVPPRKLTLGGDANFDFDQATLTADARARLDRLADQAKGIAFQQVTVDGYTDSMGTAAYNVALSERRAQSVAAYLREHGLDARQYATHGYGKANPVASNATEAGRAQNRRVEIQLTPLN